MTKGMASRSPSLRPPGPARIALFYVHPIPGQRLGRQDVRRRDQPPARRLTWRPSRPACQDRRLHRCDLHRGSTRAPDRACVAAQVCAAHGCTTRRSPRSLDLMRRAAAVPVLRRPDGAPSGARGSVHARLMRAARGSASRHRLTVQRYDLTRPNDGGGHQAYIPVQGSYAGGDHTRPANRCSSQAWATDIRRSSPSPPAGKAYRCNQAAQFTSLTFNGVVRPRPCSKRKALLNTNRLIRSEA